jgi:hypothetical protein
MKQRVIAFGASYVYGHGLPDCHLADNGPGLTPSIYAWPQIVADQLSLECVNMSAPGSSNKRIWHTIINFNFKETDIAFVLWTGIDRTCVLKNATVINDIGPWMDDATEYYKKYHTDYDAEMQAKLYISHSNLMMPRLYNLITAEKHEHLLSIGDTRVEHLPIYLNYITHKYPLSLDNIHPGVECHRAFAEEICKLI